MAKHREWDIKGENADGDGTQTLSENDYGSVVADEGMIVVNLDVQGISLFISREEWTDLVNLITEAKDADSTGLFYRNS